MKMEPDVYGLNNPIRFVDPDSMWPDNPFNSIVDETAAFGVMVQDCFIRPELRGEFTPANAADYNRGQYAGKIASVVGNVNSFAKLRLTNNIVSFRVKNWRPVK